MRKLSIVLLAVCLLSASSYATIYSIYKDPNLYGHLGQNDPALIGLLGARAAVACGPVAVTNSYRYLENKYHDVYDNSLTADNLAQTAANLANLMNTQLPGGTYADDLIWYKQQYIEQRVPNVTVYEAQFWPTWGWSIWDNPGLSQPSWVHSQVPTWEWLYNQLAACEDVEILLTYASGDGGHFVTVSSFNFNDVSDDYDISQTDGAKIDFIDPATGTYTEVSLWNATYYGYNSLYVNYGGGAWITMAVKESIPEPATILILLAGGLLLRRKN